MTHRLPLIALALSTAVSAIAASAIAASTHGYLEGRGFAFLEQTVESDPDAIGWATLYVEHERSLTRRVQLIGSVRAEGISSAARGPLELDVADRQLRRTPLSVRELYVRARLRPGLDLQLGRFAIGWGRTDGYSPTDAFLPRDLSDPFSDERLPLIGARLLGQRGALRYEVVATATTTPWRLPELGGRYAPVDVPQVTLVDGAGEPPTRGFTALRLSYAGDDGDVGAWLRVGTRPAPLLAFRLDQARVGSNGAIVPVDRRYVDERGVGIELTRVLGSYIARSEMAYLDSADRELSDAWLWSLSAERSFGDATLLATVANNLRDTPIDPALLLDRSLLPLAIVAWSRTTDWGSYRLVSTTALEHGDGMVEAEARYNLDDVWSIEVGTDLPYGSSEGPIGALGGARRVRVGVRRAW